MYCVSDETNSVLCLIHVWVFTQFLAFKIVLKIYCKTSFNSAFIDTFVHKLSKSHMNWLFGNFLKICSRKEGLWAQMSNFSAKAFSIRWDDHAHVFIVLAHWSNTPQIDMSLQSNTLPWFWANQSLLFLLNAACLAKK